MKNDDLDHGQRVWFKECGLWWLGTVAGFRGKRVLVAKVYAQGEAILVRRKRVLPR